MTDAESGRLGIIAGNGSIPPMIARAARASGRETFLVALKGDASRESLAMADCALPWFDLDAVCAALREHGCSKIVIIGGIARPDLSALTGVRIDPDLLRRAARRFAAKGQGDSQLFSVLIDWLEENAGFRVIGPEDVCPDLRAEEGLLAGPAPGEGHRRDIDLGLRAARRLGELDIGQAVVACRGLVLGVEAVEGTAALLERIAGLPERQRGSQTTPAGVLVKLPRPGQDSRMDLPVIGPETIKAARAARLAGIACIAGGVLLCEREKMREEADRAGLFIDILPRAAGSS